jgi:outer membrane protein
MKKKWLVLGAAVSIGWAPMSASGVEWTVGLGIGVTPDYQGSEDYEAVPLWNILARDLYDPNTYVNILGPTLRSNFLAHDNFRLGVSGQYVGKRDDVDNSQVDAMKSTDDGLLLGILLGYDFKLSNKRVLGLEVDSRWDTADDIGGLFTLRTYYSTPFGTAWRFRGAVESTYATDDYMDEYFSVDSRDSTRSGLSTFSADEGFKDVALSASLTYRITGNWSATGTAKYTRLLGDAEDSPVTDTAGDKNQMFGGLIINYSF